MSATKQKTTSYFGGKGSVWRTIVNQMPPHLVYVEACLGGGAVVRNKLPAIHNIGIDLNPEVIETAKGWEVPNLELLKVDCRDWLEETFLGLFQRDRIRVGNAWIDVQDVLVYIDPPYPIETRTSATRYLFDCDDDSPRWHARLLEVVRKLPCRVMLSTRPNYQYQEALLAKPQGWCCYEFQGMTRGGLADEWLFCNFVGTHALHDPRWIGSNKRRREVVRRRMDTLKRRWKRASHRERAAMLALVVELASADGVDFSDVVSLSRTIGPTAFAGGQNLDDLPWPKCETCGVGLAVFESGLICPDGHGKLVPRAVTSSVTAKDPKKSTGPKCIRCQRRRRQSDSAFCRTCSKEISHV